MSNEEEIQAHLEKKEVRAIFIIMGLSLLIFVIFVVSLFYGVGNIPRQTVLDILFNNGGTRGQNYVVKEMRIPRAICAATVGAGLAISGMSMQALFRNPMASPSTLGISSGAAFGASIAIAFGIGTAIGGALADCGAEFISIFYGEDVDSGEAEGFSEAIGSLVPDAEISLVSGGQPVYYYLISAE